MPTYAILGATGQTGQAILNILRRSPDVTIRAFVRSRQKLLKQNAGLAECPQLEIYEGDISDISTLASCISFPCSAVFSCVATNENIPRTTIALDTAHTVVAALLRLRQEAPQDPLPRIIVLSSAIINDRLCRKLSSVGRGVLYSAFNHIYADLERAEKFYTLHQSWMTAIFVQPGGLVHDAPTGHILSTEEEHTFLSYADLAGGIIELAELGEEYDWQGVSVLAKGKTGMNWEAPLVIMRGLTWCTMPWLYWAFQKAGLIDGAFQRKAVAVLDKAASFAW